MTPNLKSAAAAALILACLASQAWAGSADQQSQIDSLTGQMLSAVDGSTITLQPSEDGWTRVLIAPDGRVERTHFGFLSQRLGVVSDVRDPNKLLGVFREGGTGIEAHFADGHDEWLAATTDGALTLTISGAGGAKSCMAWYPKGHVFSEEQRRAALAAYAERLGVPLPGAKGHPQPDSCAVPATAPKQEEAAARPGPPSLAETAAHAAKAGAKHAASGKQAAAETPIMVRASVVHPIDGPAGALADMQGANAGAEQGPAASSCLSVDSDGKHWGFRNACGYPVQFVYCLKDGGDPLTACSNGSVSGSVASKGFAALSADNTLSEKDANHDFRWVGCRGGAGEVVPRLDRTSPPAGRCIRAQAS